MNATVRSGGKTRLLGVFAVEPRKDGQGVALRVVWPRLFLVFGVAGLFGYTAFVGAGYYWLHHVRKIEQIGVVDVALFQWKDVRRAIALQQFAQGKTEWEQKAYSKAYLSFTSALRNDPSNTAGRLTAASFLDAMGATNVELSVLEGGLSREPGERRIFERTLDLLTSSGRDAKALALIRGKLSSQRTGPNAVVLQNYEVLATLNVEGAAKAKQLLDGYPELLKNPKYGYTVGRVLWESKQRFEAIQTLVATSKDQPDAYAIYALLLDYQQSAGMVDDARHTAELAVTNLPGDIRSRLLLIASFEPGQPADNRRWQEEIGRYFKDFGNRADAIVRLGELGGRKGWLGLVRFLYELGASRQNDIRTLAMYYSDALMRANDAAGASRLLKDLETQTSDDHSFELMLWQRQVYAFAALNDADGVRESARRLVTALSREPEQLEVCRRRFAKMGISEAVAEMTDGAAKPRAEGLKG